MAVSEGDIMKTLSQQILLGALLCSTFTSTTIARKTTALVQRDADRVVETEAPSGHRIDRRALVRRHSIIINKSDPLTPLSVGNGEFAFTADITGLQTFPEYHQQGMALGTQSQWGWKSHKSGGSGLAWNVTSNGTE